MRLKKVKFPIFLLDFIDILWLVFESISKKKYKMVA